MSINYQKVLEETHYPPMVKVSSEPSLRSRIRLFTTPWTAAFQAPASKGFSRPDWASLELSPSVESCGCGLGPSPVRLG